MSLKITEINQSLSVFLTQCHLSHEIFREKVNQTIHKIVVVKNNIPIDLYN